jgi:hypothetical protein
VYTHQWKEGSSASFAHYPLIINSKLTYIVRSRSWWRASWQRRLPASRYQFPSAICAAFNWVGLMYKDAMSIGELIQIRGKDAKWVQCRNGCALIIESRQRWLYRHYDGLIFKKYSIGFLITMIIDTKCKDRPVLTGAEIRASASGIEHVYKDLLASF